MLYIAQWWNGDKKKGKYYFDKALEINPYHPTYLGETKFHYEYLGTNIIGNLSFQETQYLYDEAKKYSSILQVGCNNGRATHALLTGCNGLVSVITKRNENGEFIKNVGSFGNIKIIKMTSDEADKELCDEKFDMIFIEGENNDEIKNDILLWIKHAKKLICGSNYNNNKKSIDESIESFEISGLENDIWFKNISSFQKTIIYKRKC